MNFKSQVPMTVAGQRLPSPTMTSGTPGCPTAAPRTAGCSSFSSIGASPPTVPSWNASSDYRFNPAPFSLPINGQSEAYKHRIMWRSVWDWLHGEPVAPGSSKW
ncbi:MAG: hypothetical protein R3E79_26280 [Caldilineaceae bacterium]